MGCGKILFVLGLFALAAGTASAQLTWNVTDGDWGTTGNWTPSGTPGPGITVAFNTGVSSEVDANYSLTQVNLNPGLGNTMNLNGAFTLTLSSGLSSSSGTSVVNPNIAGTGATVSVTGGSNLVLAGNNTYTGATTVTGSTLEADSVTAFGNLSQLTLNGSAVVNLDGFSNTIGSLNSTSGTAGVYLTSASLTIGSTGGPYLNSVYAGTITGTGGLTYDTYGFTLTLTGNGNTYQGTTAINNGTIEVGNGNASGTIGAGNILLGANSEILFARSDSNTYANLIAGVGTVGVNFGTVTLTGDNTWNGTATVNDGTLIVGSANALGGGEGPVTLIDGTLNLNNYSVQIGSLTTDSASVVNLGSGNLSLHNDVASTTFAGTLEGTGGLTTITANFNVTSNTMTYSGGLTIQEGAYIANNSNPADSATGTGNIVINGGGGSFLQIGSDSATGYIDPSAVISGTGVLNFQRTDSVSFPNLITGLVEVVVQDGGTITLTGANTYGGLTNVDMSTLKAGSATALGNGTSAFSINSNGGELDLNGFNIGVGSIEGGSVSSGGIINLGANTLTIGGIPGSTTFAGIIEGSGGLTLTGPATEVTYLVNANTYTGPTVIEAGAVLGLGFESQAGSIMPNGGVSGTGTLEFYEPTATTYAGVLSGGLNVTQIGSAGAVTLSGANTYTGATTINAGTLIAGSTTAFGNGSAVTINGTGVLNLNNFSVSIGSLTGTSTSSVLLGSGILTITGDPTYNGVISGTGGLDLTGSATTLLNGANTYSGTTTISSVSTLQVGDGGTPGASITGNVADSGSLIFIPNSADAITYAGNISGTGGVMFTGTGTIYLSGDNTYTGLTQVESGTVEGNSTTAFAPSSNVLVYLGATVVANTNVFVGALKNGPGGGGGVVIAEGSNLYSQGQNYAGDFGGTVSGGGGIRLNGGTQGFSGDNTYTGGTYLTSISILSVGSDNALGTGPITFSGEQTELQPDADVTLGNSIVLDSAMENLSTGTSSLTLTGNISGGSGIEWNSPGTLTLSGTSSSFSGGIIMEQGALVIGAGTTGATGSGTISLASGTSLVVGSESLVANTLMFPSGQATLSGAGTISSAVTVNANVLVAPAQSLGGGPANLSFSGGLTLATGGTIQFQLYDANGTAGTGYSLVSAPGGISITATTGTFDIDLKTVTSTGSAASAVNFSSSSSYTWTLATSDTAITGFNASDFTIVSSGFANSTGTGSFSVTESGDNLLLNFSPVPEPSTWALLGAGAAACGAAAMLRRRRRA